MTRLRHWCRASLLQKGFQSCANGLGQHTMQKCPRRIILPVAGAVLQLLLSSLCTVINQWWFPCCLKVAVCLVVCFFSVCPDTSLHSAFHLTKVCAAPNAEPHPNCYLGHAGQWSTAPALASQESERLWALQGWENPMKWDSCKLVEILWSQLQWDCFSR